MTGESLIASAIVAGADLTLRPAAPALDPYVGCFSVSPRHLNRLVRIWIGCSAKRFATIARFQSALCRMEGQQGISAAIVAGEGGYFDQAHLSQDTFGFARETPRRLAAERMADFSKTRCGDRRRLPAS